MIPEDKIRNVCKIGQGNDTCKYVTLGSDGFSCAKLTPLKKQIDSRTDMSAKGDNCIGMDCPVCKDTKEWPTLNTCYNCAEEVAF